MFTFNNFESDDIPYILKKLFPTSNKEFDSLPVLFQMNEPYRMQIVHFRPNEEEHHFTMTSLSPDSIIYSTLEKKEVGLRLTPHLHQCEFYEFMMVLDGNIYQIIENERHLYTTGSCCLLNPNIRHAWEFSSEFRIVILQICVDFLKSILDDLALSFFEIEQLQPSNNLETFLHSDLEKKRGKQKNYIDFIPIQENKWIVDNMHRLLDAIANTTLFPSIGASHIIKSILFRLLQLLSSSDNYETTPSQIGTKTENILYNQIAEIMESTHGRATRKDLEEQLNYSGNYLNNIVKKYTGLSISNYGMSICLKEAGRLLVNTDKNISEISAMLGFTNRTHFYKAFENMFHMTPTKFRKQYKKTYKK